MEHRKQGRFFSELLKIRQALKENKTQYNTAGSPVNYSLKEQTYIEHCSAQEVSERKRFEKELNLSRQLFFKIFQCSPLLMSITTFGDFRYVDINEAFTSSSGFLREEIINQTVEDLNILPDEEFKRLKSLIRQGANRNLEFNFNTKSGETRAVIISFEYVDLDNQKCLLWEIRDVTEMKILQRELARLDQLNLVGEMAASIGHEIRNPMTTARGFLQMLGSKQQCGQYKEYFDLIIEELDRANTIVTEFLSMAQIKPDIFESRNINKIIKTLLPLIKADALIKDISVETNLGEIPDLPLVENEIRQLILNLARNALESMPSSGTIKIKTHTEDIDVVLSIQDQGTGIKPELIGKIGTPFLTTKEKGTGLGLTICYSIAARHNAVITFDTGPEGTIFYVRFKNRISI